jgi:hypothetical protein
MPRMATTISTSMKVTPFPPLCGVLMIVSFSKVASPLCPGTHKGVITHLGELGNAQCITRGGISYFRLVYFTARAGSSSRRSRKWVTSSQRDRFQIEAAVKSPFRPYL